MFFDSCNGYWYAEKLTMPSSISSSMAFFITRRKWRSTMISDKERCEVANNLRDLTNDDFIQHKEQFFDALAEVVVGSDNYRDTKDILNKLADLIEPRPIDGETSDGYHTFNELYHHRAVLFSVIVATFSERAWKSKLHADGTMYDGMFIVGIETPDGQATYHYDVDPYWDLFRCTELERAPEWDGHTPNQAIERIGKLVDAIDRPTCKYVQMNAAGNPPFYTGKIALNSIVGGCSRCGYPFGNSNAAIGNPFNAPNFCPNCGAEVRQ